MHRCLQIVLLGAMAISSHDGRAASASPAGNGELRIEGHGIEQLILRDRKGNRRTFKQPGTTMTLPPGDYHVHSVRLQGGHDSQSHLIPTDLRVTVDPNEPAALKVGAPLRQVVKVERQGPTLLLSYELTGQGGEQDMISRNQGSQRPAFAVYKGGRKVASADFEFG